MSVVQACAEVQAVIERARSLFVAEPEPTATNGVSAITGAAQSNGAAGHLPGDQSGKLISQHKFFVDQSAGTLTAAARSDATLSAHVTTAAAVTQAGAERLTAIAAETQATSQAAATVSTPTGEKAIMAALRSQVARASQVVNSAQQQAAGLAGQIRALQYPHDIPQSGGTQPLDSDIPLTPAPKDPRHGKDPRYWIDVGKIIFVPDGKLAPYGYEQIGPNRFYPAPDGSLNYQPPPAPVQHPLDIADIRHVPAGQLLPPGYKLVAPDIGLPDPDAFYQPHTPWTPEEPVDIRDIIQVPPGQLAPWGYVEYFPGWFAPGPELANTPTIPKPR